MKFHPPAEFQLFKPTVLDKLEAHCLDKHAYLCRLLRRLEGDCRVVARNVLKEGANQALDTHSLP